jgi:hypothetical protein
VRTGRAAMALATGVLLALLPASGASASYPAGTTGHDVSYPQCSPSGGTGTTVTGLGGAFGVVGVTGGRPWSANTCSAAEYTWAAGLPNTPSLYMNTANPAPTSTYYWPTSGSSDPALCLNAASTTDPGCAYDYGWHAAADALTTEAKNIPNAATLDWWLDVETANSWNGDGTSNAADLQGAVDYLRSHGVPAVGLYSTSAQWTTITGGYDTATVASYASAWAPEFTAQYPMTGSSVWVAGASSLSAAESACGTTFTGGPTWLAQYPDGTGFDADYSCAPPTAPGAPSNLTATGGDTTVSLSWAAPSSTGGAPVSYDVYRGTASGAESATPIATGVTATSFTDRGLTDGTTYFYEVAATNSAGTSAMSGEASATPQPAPQAFTLSVSPTAGKAKRGGSASSTVTVSESGAAQTVALSAANLPPGVTASFSPSALSSSGSATLKLAVSRSTRAGTYALSVVGTGASGSTAATYTLTVH